MPGVMRLHTGTMGFSYADWAGIFYPRGTKPGDYLAWYAKNFDTVELDTTFHATPPVDRVRRWADVTPDDFRFCPKAPRAVTHEPAMHKRIGQMHEFLDALRTFGKKLAVVLIQLPPSCGIDQFDDLTRLLAALPTDLRFAVEFRNATWGEPRTLDLLRNHNCALVAAEYLSRPAQLLTTADFTYVRLIGQHERFEELNREQLDVTPSLTWWKAQLDAAPPTVTDAYVFFNNDFSGYSVATCRRFMQLAGLPVREVRDETSLFG